MNLLIISEIEHSVKIVTKLMFDKVAVSKMHSASCERRHSKASFAG